MESRLCFGIVKTRRNYQNEKAEIWIMDADGSNLKQLTHFPNDTTAQWHSYHAGPPFWEPNQNIISYISRQKGKHNIFTMSPDGSNTKQLTTDTLSEGWHAWSPDGEWIKFDVSNKEGYKFDIYLRNRDGSGQKKPVTGVRKWHQCLCCLLDWTIDMFTSIAK